MPKPISNLDNLPMSAADHMWADYIELLCLLNVDGFISKADILDRVRERKDLGGEIEELSEDILEVTEDGSDLSSAEVRDKWSLRVDDWFKHFAYRSAIFDMFYPFVLSSDEKSLSRQTEINPKHKLYIFLLLVSAQNRIKGDRNPLTFSFEILSSLALRSCLPASADIHVFSRNPYGTRRYGGTIWEKLTKLNEDLRGKLLANEEDFSLQNNADEGLDIVAWVPMGDSVNGSLLVFAQCACTPKWVDKQHSSSAAKWGDLIHMKSPPINMVFIPYCFRQASGAWWKEHEIQKSVLVDRPRLLHWLKESHMALNELPWYAFVDEVLEQREPLF
jgi:hypothetical protein